MRELHLAVGYMAENRNRLWEDCLTKICKQNPTVFKDGVAVNGTLPTATLHLSLQPVRDNTNQLYQQLSARLNLRLMAYELCEINRFVCIGMRGNPAQPNQKLADCWAALGDLGPAYRDNPEFMAAVGAMAVDQWTRGRFAAGTDDLTTWYQLPDDVHQKLRAKLAAPAVEATFDDFFSDVWGEMGCLTGLQVSDEAKWFHINI